MEVPTSGRESFWERSLFVSSFSVLEFRDVATTVPNCARFCRFGLNLSNLDRAPRIRFSVLLRSRDSFFLNLLSISSDTRMI